MSAPTPDWLARRDGRVAPGPTGGNWVVWLDGRPLYLLTPYPVAGRFGCKVEQTNNGRRLDKDGRHASEEDALRGGLEELRKALGW